MKKLLLLLLGIASIPAAFSQGGSGIDWAADLDYLASELPAKHCNLFAKYDKAQFETAIGAIKASAGEAGDFATALKTQQLIARLGDSHTMLYFNQLMNRQQILPLGLLWVSDGLYVIQTAEENKELLGHRLTAVGKAPVETVIDSLSTLFTVDNEAMVKSMIPQLFPSLQLLEYFGFTTGRRNSRWTETRPIRSNRPIRSGRVGPPSSPIPCPLRSRKGTCFSRIAISPRKKYTISSTTPAGGVKARRSSRAARKPRRCRRSRNSAKRRSAYCRATPSGRSFST